MWRRSAAARPLAALLVRRAQLPSVRPLAVHGCGARAAAASVCPSRRGLSTNSQPVAEDDEVIVKVRAASVNPLDWHYMRGKPVLMTSISCLRARAASQMRRWL